MTGLWIETFIKIRRCRTCRHEGYILNQFVRNVLPVLIELKKKKPAVIKMCWLIHNSQSGVPGNREGLWFHLRINVMEDLRSEAQVRAVLRNKKCEMTRIVPAGAMDEIAGVDLKNFRGGADGAWDMICEQSMWVTRFVVSHDVTPGPQQCRQFLHYFANMMQQAAS